MQWKSAVDEQVMCESMCLRINDAANKTWKRRDGHGSLLDTSGTFCVLGTDVETPFLVCSHSVHFT